MNGKSILLRLSSFVPGIAVFNERGRHCTFLVVSSSSVNKSLFAF